MHRQLKYKVYFENRLIIRWKNSNGTIGYQRKRVSKNCPLNEEERTVYAIAGFAALASYMMETRRISFNEARALFNEAIGHASTR